MKKLLTVMLSLVLAIGCIGLVACSKDDGIAGTYKFHSMVYDGETLEIGDVAPWGDDILSADSVILEIKSDGTLNSISVIDGQPMSVHGTWTQEGDVITVVLGGSQNGTCTIDGNDLIMASGIISYHLKKV